MAPTETLKYAFTLPKERFGIVTLLDGKVGRYCRIGGRWWIVQDVTITYVTDGYLDGSIKLLAAPVGPPMVMQALRLDNIVVALGARQVDEI